MQDQLIQKISELPNTRVQPGRNGGSITVIETKPNGVTLTSIWTGRPKTVSYLQQYLQQRQTA